MRNRPQSGIGIMVMALAAAGMACLGCSATTVPVSFSGNSDALTKTVVVPTLDTPSPAGKNVIWCASFQMAWDRMRDDVIKEPIKVANAQEVANRLNAAKISPASLPDGSFYAAAGKMPEVAQKIKSDMAARFPDATPQLSDGASPYPAAPTLGDPLLAYAYLSAHVQFTTPYFDRKTTDTFTDSAGNKTLISSFGLYEPGFGIGHPYVAGNNRLGEQCAVLYAKRDEKSYDLQEFALDLCKDSKPSQIILARIEPKATLAATLESLEQKIDSQRGTREQRRLGNGILVVPNLSWKIDHHFKQLEGQDKLVRNPRARDYWIGEALQMVQFRLDKSGASVASESRSWYASPGYDPQHYEFTRPFLIVMKKRGEKAPYFVMWVDNAELLAKK